MSQFLFVMVMTVLIRDAKQLFIGERGGVLDPSLVVHELLYADDTLLMHASGGSFFREKQRHKRVQPRAPAAPEHRMCVPR
jgi:hypothetical protein